MNKINSKKNVAMMLLYFAILSLLTVGIIWRLQISLAQRANAACSNTGSAGRIEADFNAPATGSYVAWAEVNAPTGSEIIGGIEGQTCRSVKTTANSVWSWVPINQSNKISLQDGSFYTLNVSANTKGAQLRSIRLINNECNPNTDVTRCETEAIKPVDNTPPIITNVRQTTDKPVSPARLNFTASVSDDSGIASVELLDNSTKAVVGMMTKVGTGNDYSVTVGPYSAGNHQFYVVARDNGSPSLSIASGLVTVTVTNPPAPVPAPSPATVYQPGTYDDTVFSYSSGWSIGGSSNGENKYNGSDYWTSIGGSTATLKFKGTGILVYGAKASWHGILSATIDGKQQSNIDQYSASRIDQVELLRISGLEDKEHTIVLTNANTKNGSSSNIITALDKVVIIGQTGTTPQPEPTPGDGGVAPVNKAPTGPTRLNLSLSYNGWIGGCSSRTGCVINLSWDKAQDDSGKISYYDIYNGSQKINSTPIKSERFTHPGITSGGKYSYRVFAYDEQGLASAGSPIITRTVSCTAFLWTAYCDLR